MIANIKFRFIDKNTQCDIYEIINVSTIQSFDWELECFEKCFPNSSLVAYYARSKIFQKIRNAYKVDSVFSEKCVIGLNNSEVRISYVDFMTILGEKVNFTNHYALPVKQKITKAGVRYYSI